MMILTAPDPVSNPPNQDHGGGDQSDHVHPAPEDDHDGDLNEGEDLVDDDGDDDHSDHLVPLSAVVLAVAAPEIKPRLKVTHKVQISCPKNVSFHS